MVSTSLQMGWIESPPYFCAASETDRDVAVQYIKTPIGSLPNHKFIEHTTKSDDFKAMPLVNDVNKLSYLVEVYADNYISLAIPTSQEQLTHVATAIMMGVHDVFPADINDDNDPLSLKKLEKLEAMWALHKDILGLAFDGVEKTP